MKRTSKKTLTSKDLGLTEDVKLSTQYSNTENCFRTVSDQILGYYVVPGGRSSPVRVAPIYKADTWIRSNGNLSSIISSYEIGEYLNDEPPDSEPDVDGNALAAIAAAALAALERHASFRAASLKRKRKKKL